MPTRRERLQAGIVDEVDRQGQDRFGGQASRAAVRLLGMEVTVGEALSPDSVDALDAAAPAVAAGLAAGTRTSG